MTNMFESLDDNKKKRILNAALAEFAENGYERASTNRIVKSAGIGKGMLFYYFQNKKELYHYLVQYSLDIMIHDYLHLIDDTEPDFIERFKQASRMKMQCYTEHPYAFNFIGTFILSTEDDLPFHLQSKFEILQQLGNAKLYDNIDYSLFRDDVEVEKVFQLIRWSIEGYQNELKNRLQGEIFTSIDITPYWDEFYEYLAILKTAFYK